MSQVRQEQPSMLARAEEIQTQIHELSSRDMQLWYRKPGNSGVDSWISGADCTQSGVDTTRGKDRTGLSAATVFLG